MKISAALAADLRLLTEALDTVGADLGEMLAELAANVREAVPACCGLRLLLLADDFPFAVTAVTAQPAGPVMTTVSVPLDLIARASPGSTIIFYASEGGAVPDFAADVADLLGLAPDRVAVGSEVGVLAGPAHLPVDGMSNINRAVGVLLDRGFEPADARTELRRLAAETGDTTERAAEHVLLSSARGSG